MTPDRKASEMPIVRRDRYGLEPIYYSVGQTLMEADWTYGNTMRECHLDGAAWESIRLLPAGHELALGDFGAFVTPWTTQRITPNDHSRPQAARHLREALDASCASQARPGKQAILLSGGIDSAAVAVGLLQAGQDLTAYTAVYDPASPDLKSARQVADRLGLELVEVKIPHPTLADLAETIRVIEMPYKAQVEIGWPCLVLGEVIAKAGHEIVYGGEGSDELWASHAFAYHERKRPNAPSWHDYRARDFAKQASRNFVREWKVWDRWGLEVRLPFLDQAVVEYILALPEDTCRDSTWHAKRPLQEAYRADLPQWVTERQKLGFQDGLKIKDPIAEGMGLTQREVGTWYRAQYDILFPGARPTKED